MNVEEAARAVLAGEVVAFPTETVYGLMALPEAAEKIYAVKRRPADKQLVVMAASVESLEEVVLMPPRARAFAGRYWPGPLTLVLPAVSGDGTTGVRIPHYEPALSLLRAVGRPVVTTSANLSGRPPALRAAAAHFEGVAGVVDGGPSPGGVPSTVLLLDRTNPRVSRDGAIPGRELLLYDLEWKFGAFAEREARGSSPLWEAASAALAAAPDVLELMLGAREGQAIPNLMLGSIHRLVLDGRGGPLAAYFPSVGGTRPVDAAAGGAIVEFARAHAEILAPLIATRATQTNEVGRASVLLLGLSQLEGPLALVEVGCSGGLLLNLDRYHYDYGGAELGDPDSRVRLVCELRGGAPTPRATPQIAWRRGLDQDPVDVSDPAGAGWLEALVWPEHTDRLERLRSAIALAAEHPPPVERGDLLDDLPRLVAEAGRYGTPVVLHSHVLPYVPGPVRHAFTELVPELGAHRVGFEFVPGLHAHLTLDGRGLASGNAHGRWLEWLADTV